MLVVEAQIMLREALKLITILIIFSLLAEPCVGARHAVPLHGPEVRSLLAPRAAGSKGRIERIPDSPDLEQAVAKIVACRKSDGFQALLYARGLGINPEQEPHLERTIDCIRQTARHTGRETVIVIGAASGLADMPLDTLAEFENIVFININRDMLWRYQMRVKQIPELRNRNIRYVQYDVTAKVVSFVKGIDRIYSRYDSGDSDAAIQRAARFYSSMAGNQLGKIPFEKEADLVISPLVITVLGQAECGYQAYLQRKLMGGRTVILDDGRVATIIPNEQASISDDTVRVLSEAQQRFIDVEIAQHYELLHRMVKSEGRVLLTADVSGFKYRPTADYADTARLKREGPEYFKPLFIKAEQEVSLRVPDLFEVSQQWTWDLILKLRENEASRVVAVMLEPKRDDNSPVEPKDGSAVAGAP